MLGIDRSLMVWRQAGGREIPDLLSNTMVRCIDFMFPSANSEPCYTSTIFDSAGVMNITEITFGDKTIMRIASAILSHILHTFVHSSLISDQQ